MTKPRYNKISMRCMGDESLVRLLIATVRDKYEPALANHTELRPTQDEAASVVSELLDRLATGRAALDVVGEERAHARRQARARDGWES